MGEGPGHVGSVPAADRPQWTALPGRGSLRPGCCCRCRRLPVAPTVPRLWVPQPWVLLQVLGGSLWPPQSLHHVPTAAKAAQTSVIASPGNTDSGGNQARRKDRKKESRGSTSKGRGAPCTGGAPPLRPMEDPCLGGRGTWLPGFHSEGAGGGGRGCSTRPLDWAGPLL